MGIEIPQSEDLPGKISCQAVAHQKAVESGPAAVGGNVALTITMPAHSIATNTDSWQRSRRVPEADVSGVDVHVMATKQSRSETQIGKSITR